VSPFGVFGLMAKAKAAGTTLQKVLHCLSLSSGLASVKNLYAYISEVLARPRDWDRIERRIQASQSHQLGEFPDWDYRLLARREAEEEARRRKEFAHLEGMVFYRPKNGFWYKVLGELAMVFYSEEDFKNCCASSGCTVEMILDMVKTGEAIPAPLANA
jgi:hypothetical protein